MWNKSDPAQCSRDSMLTLGIHSSAFRSTAMQDTSTRLAASNTCGICSMYDMHKYNLTFSLELEASSEEDVKKIQNLEQLPS